MSRLQRAMMAQKRRKARDDDVRILDALTEDREAGASDGDGDTLAPSDYRAAFAALVAQRAGKAKRYLHAHRMPEDSSHPRGVLLLDACGLGLLHTVQFAHVAGSPYPNLDHQSDQREAHRTSIHHH
jgi:hypothetical protein